MEVTLPEASWEIVGPISHSLIANNNLFYSKISLCSKLILQVISDFDKTLTKFSINGEKGSTVYGEFNSVCYFLQHP